MADSIRINRIYDGIQSHGPHAGTPAAIVLFDGCRINCAIPGLTAQKTSGIEITVDEAVRSVRETCLSRVLVAGGEPMLQEGCLDLINRLLESDLTVTLESHATIDFFDIDKRVKKLVNLICPSNGACTPIRWSNLALLSSSDSVMFVIADRGDYVWARDVIKREGLLDLLTVQLSPFSGALKPKNLAEWILDDRLPVRLQIPLDQILT